MSHFNEIHNVCMIQNPIVNQDVNGFRDCIYGNISNLLTVQNGGKPIDGLTLRNSEYGIKAKEAVAMYAIKSCKNPSHYTKVPPSLINSGCVQQPGNSFFNSYNR